MGSNPTTRSSQGSIQPNLSNASKPTGENKGLTGILKEQYQNPRPPLQQVPNFHQQSSPVAGLLRVQDQETRHGRFLKVQAW